MMPPIIIGQLDYYDDEILDKSAEEETQRKTLGIKTLFFEVYMSKKYQQ